MSKFVAAIASCLVCLLSVPASGVSVYSTFGPGDSFNSSSGTSLGYVGGAIDSVFVQGMSFQVTEHDYYLDSVDVALSSFRGSDSVLLSVLMDNGGMPGAFLGSAVVTAPVRPARVVFAEMSGSVVLQGGNQYWLVGETIGGGVNDWWRSEPAVTGLRAYTRDGGAWQDYPATLAAFRINGTIVPEPMTLISFGGVVGGIGAYLRRRLLVH